MKREDLPKPYQDLIRKRSNPIRQLEQPLVSAFSWADTPEGHAFWMAVDMAKTVEDLPAIPQKKRWRDGLGSPLIGLTIVMLFIGIILLFSYLIREENKKQRLNNRIDKDIRDMAIKMRQERERYLAEGK